jgi:hypothetical protein
MSLAFQSAARAHLYRIRLPAASCGRRLHGEMTATCNAFLEDKVKWKAESPTAPLGHCHAGFIGFGSVRGLHVVQEERF